MLVEMLVDLERRLTILFASFVEKFILINNIQPQIWNK